MICASSAYLCISLCFHVASKRKDAPVPQGCWLMTDQAKLNEKGDVPSEAFAVSGARPVKIKEFLWRQLLKK